jgi:hypothetical protein
MYTIAVSVRAPVLSIEGSDGSAHATHHSCISELVHLSRIYIREKPTLKLREAKDLTACEPLRF